MATRASRNSKQPRTTKAVVLPADAPSWLTEELVLKTLEVWQPFYDRELIVEDAVAMIMGVGQIYDVFAEGPRHEAVRCPSSRQQS